MKRLARLSFHVMPLLEKTLKPERLFLVIGVTMGLLFCIFTAPFQVPDEFAHFYKAYQVSELQFLPGVNADSVGGGMLPQSFRLLEETFLWMTTQPKSTVSIERLKALLETPLAAEDRAFFTFRVSSLYAPAGYLPQAIGLRLSRLVTSSLLGNFYLGRMVNLLFWAAITYWAIRITPVQKWVMFVFALMPMTIAEAASYSIDGFLNSLSFLYFALILRLALDANARVSWKTVGVWAALMTVITLAKPAYLALALFVLFIPPARFGSRLRGWLSFFLVSLIPLLAYFLWLQALRWRGLDLSPADGIIPALQVQWILSHPLEYLKILLETYSDLALPFIVGFIGYYGWLNQPLPVYIYPLFILFSFYVILFDRDAPQARLRSWQRLLVIVILLLSLASIATSIYVITDPLAHPQIEGIQGRYFIPISVFLGLALYLPILRINPWLLRILTPAISLWFVILGLQTALQRIAF